MTSLNVASGRVPAKLGCTDTGTTEGRFELASADAGSARVWRISRSPAGPPHNDAP